MVVIDGHSKHSSHGWSSPACPNSIRKSHLYSSPFLLMQELFTDISLKDFKESLPAASWYWEIDAHYESSWIKVLFFLLPNERMMTFFAKKNLHWIIYKFYQMNPNLASRVMSGGGQKRASLYNLWTGFAAAKKVDNVSCVFGDLYYSDFGGLSLATLKFSHLFPSGDLTFLSWRCKSVKRSSSPGAFEQTQLAKTDPITSLKDKKEDWVAELLGQGGKNESSWALRVGAVLEPYRHHDIMHYFPPWLDQWGFGVEGGW